MPGLIGNVTYRWTSLYARDADSKNRLTYNECAYKKTKDDCKLEDWFQKKAISGSHIRKIADKKTAYNEGHLYFESQRSKNVVTGFELITEHVLRRKG